MLDVSGRLTIGYVPKPYTGSEILQRLADLLDSRSRASGD